MPITSTAPAPAPTAPSVSLNTEQRLYVQPCVSNGRVTGYTTLGFEYLEARLNAVAAWCGRSLDAESAQPGTLARYALYQEVMAEAGAHAARTGTRCPAELTPALVGLEGRRVEVVDRYGETRRFRVGKSTGWMPCHLEIRGREGGGPAVMGAPFQSVRVIR